MISLLGTAYITDCVLGELEKFGRKYRLALRLVKDPRFERLPCTHKGTYVDDCIVNRVTMHKCWIVATCDKDLKRRLRKIPGVPIMYVKTGRYSIERMPEAYGGIFVTFFLEKMNNGFCFISSCFLRQRNSFISFPST